MQELDIEHEIFVFDDASTDGTWDVICSYARKYPGKFKACKRDKNIGQGLNLRGAIGATKGDFVAILEGDDYWADNKKLYREIDFLVKNSDLSMAFSALDVLDESSGNRRILERQSSIKTQKLTAEDFINHPTLNLFGSFSCCTFRRYVLQQLDPSFYEGRLSEIALAFFFDRFGYIGFIKEIGAVYRQHSNGLWTGANSEEKTQMMLAARYSARKLAREIWHEKLSAIIDSIESSNLVGSS